MFLKICYLKDSFFDDRRNNFSAFIGIGLAKAGYGVWALVAQQLSNATVDTVILWITVRWRPRKNFSWERLKGLLSFGWKLLVSSLLDTCYNNLRNLIIGKCIRHQIWHSITKETNFQSLLLLTLIPP